MSHHRTKEHKSDLAPCSPPEYCPIVALGASAGGLDAFTAFLDRTPAETGLAFVLIQHLDPHYESSMPELLAKHTQMKVLRAEDGIKVEANRVYIIPPNAALRMERCAFKLDSLSNAPNRRVIDRFFRSAAEAHKECVIGVVLSGTGTDGTFGLKSIKENGGLTLAQRPETAKFDRMPGSAISAGFVDLILNVEEMPARIVAYAKHLAAVHRRKGAAVIETELHQLLPKFFPVLKKRTGHDFSRYKQSTVMRRIQRRMQVRYQDAPAKYLECLRNEPEEADALFKDLLIGVTQFFRDADSFAVLAEQVIPVMFADKSADDTVRAWVPGCASGEEAYTIAILLTEYAEKMGEKPRIQVFATDLDIEALEFARKGRYPEDIAEQLSAERLKRCFKKTQTGYEVLENLRECCVFSPHNLIKDPPFSKLDLISCRNVLIYLEAELQKKLLPLFHYSLNPSGYLFLGPSENVASRSELFRVIDQNHRLFQRKPAVLHSPVNVPVPDAGHVTRLQTLTTPVMSSREPGITRSIERVILEEYAPASVVINQQGEALYLSGNTGDYLEPPSGVPTNRIVAMARGSLRLELRTAIHQAVSTRKEVIRRKLGLEPGADGRQIDLIVRPLPELGNEGELYIVIFREILDPDQGGTPAISSPADQELPIVKQLENELRTTREDLQTTIEELETSNEELKSANEELLSMNEELQSANEELQTSKEEVQSANEELQRKIEENDAATAELRRSHEERARLAALVQNSEDAIISKTLEGVITSWNKAAERMFGFTADEIIGQSILKIIPANRYEEEAQILRRLRLGERVAHYETERITRNGTIVQVSLTASPIRDAQGFIIGAAKIARDITAQKNAQRSSLLLAAIVDSSDDAIVSKTLDGVVTSWNKAAEKIFGYTAAEMIGQPITKLFPDDRLDEEPEIIRRIASGNRVEHFETIRKTKRGRLIEVSLTISPVKDASGNIIGASKIARDVTLRNEQTRVLEVLNATGTAIASELKLDALVQIVTDAGTKLTGAKFGAFFYNVTNAQGESYLLYTLSGAPREAFEKFGLPRNTPVFEHTFRGKGVMRSDDITKDPRYGTMAPHFGMPKGHLPVRSYLAASVISRSGEVIGGLFFGHPEPGVFNERAEKLIAGIAAQASIAIDNARLYDRVQRELAERTRAENELKEAKEHLEQRVKERTASLHETTQQLEAFCYTIAHDLRSPLRAQQSFAQTLLDEYQAVLGPEGREYATRIVQAAQRLDRLVQDLLTYSRLSRGELKLETVDLNKVFRDVQHAHADEIRSRHAQITSETLHPVFAYQPTVFLMMSNLLSNALKFVPSGAVPHVKVWSERRNDRVRLWVQDNGIGIAPENINKIFGVFERLHSVNKYPGTGIGLAIVQKGAERMGGTAGVESEPGKGSRFWIELPAVQELSSGEDKPSRPEAAGT